jgi:hypothetical protein
MLIIEGSTFLSIDSSGMNATLAYSHFTQVIGALTYPGENVTLSEVYAGRENMSV